MNSNDDQKLKAYLLKHAPVAPSAPRDELIRLLNRLEDEKKANERIAEARNPSPWSFGTSWTWLGAGAALVASLVSFWMVTQSPALSPTERSREESALVAFAIEPDNGAQDEDFDSLEINADGPSTEVGDEYIGLIADSVVF